MQVWQLKPFRQQSTCPFNIVVNSRTTNHQWQNTGDTPTRVLHIEKLSHRESGVGPFKHQVVSSVYRHFSESASFHTISSGTSGKLSTGMSPVSSYEPSHWSVRWSERRLFCTPSDKHQRQTRLQLSPQCMRTNHMSNYY